MNYQVCVDIMSRSVSKTGEGGRGRVREGEGEREGRRGGREVGEPSRLVYIYTYVHKTYK